MGLDRLEVDHVMDVVKEQVEKVRRAREKGKEPRVEAKKADASRRQNVPAFYLQTVRRLSSQAVTSASR